MKKISTSVIIGVFVILASFSALEALEVPCNQNLVITANGELTITVPLAISYTLSDPFPGNELIAAGQQVTLKGNNFNNSSPMQPYITAYAEGGVGIPQAELHVVITNIAVSGTVTASPPGPLINLNATPQNYAIPDVPQVETYGTILGTHNLHINKVGTVPQGTYVVVIVWSGNDGSF